MIELRDVTFDYSGSDFKLRIPSLKIGKDERVALIGPSGCGKTTLIRLMCGILQAHSGTVMVDGIDYTRSSDKQRRSYRAERIGMVFQDFELMPYLNVINNVLLPYSLGIALDPSAKKRAETLLERLEMTSKIRQMVLTLSAGEKQRVAIARALVTSPSFLIGDEPTGKLDPKTADVIMDILFEVAAGRTFVMVTHDHRLLSRFDRVIDMQEYL